MFNADPSLIARLGLHIERVLIVDPFPGSAKLQSDMMRRLGTLDVAIIDKSKRAYELAEHFNPQIVLTEYAGPDVDGALFTRMLRRSPFHCRRAAVIVVTAEATEQSIKASRDSGAHEFLKKPFAALDLTKRIENVALKARPWVEAQHYVGPCRRRFNSGSYHGPRKRKSDEGSAAEATYAGQIDQSLKIIKSAIVQYDQEPIQAARALRAQALNVSGIAANADDARLSYAVRALIGQMDGAIRRGVKPTMPAGAIFEEVTQAAGAVDTRLAA